MKKKEEKFKLVIPTEKYKRKAIRYIKEHNRYHSEINGSGFLYMYINDYKGWLKKLEQDKSIEANNLEVPSQTYFFIRAKDDEIIGMVNIRTKTNNRVANSFGNIGYGIRPKERRKGYNKINLYLALLECQKFGMEEVILSCKKDNIASSKTMKALGANFDREVYDEMQKTIIQFYKINVNYSVEKYKEKYNKYIADDN